ncbi:SusC/RagA family TonB-linked outer membrane protein [Thermophagus xiamenensis]|uniref:TonB-linked outer membrane protein, SusC/RagA family n=1 Tax=Thermophagus xiamenensis TaxID=385682 RepID=A0A1I2AUD4_9BACT|nr:SusC/RagA family TonB-linked outer membrane protein [Thermophagus xiamenensis]SFE47594.1 TonB-linked outer membrane protein, SusC/RagA family [Thermophagus xiamenensis]
MDAFKFITESLIKKLLSQGKCFLLLLTLFFFFASVEFSQAAYPQALKQVSGTIIDERGEPIPGVNIVLKGSSLGTVTDINGHYVLDISGIENPVLVISFIGYETTEISVGNKDVIDVVLKPTDISLDEVVVVGYGTMRKKDLTGSIVQIRPENVADENPKTVQDILRGTPGLYVGFDASAKGGGSMQIRGQRSVYTAGGHNDPLIILDGMIFYGELSEINPDDIAQIDVLKDASAAAVYGAKSANGVIIVTTKKGKIGKPTINFTSSIGFATMGINREVYGPDEYLQFYEDWFTAPTYGLNSETGKYEAYQTTYEDKPGYYARPSSENLAKYGISLEQWRSYTNNEANASDNEIWARRVGIKDKTLENYLVGKTFDWYDHSFRTGINQDYNVSLSGATDGMNYYMSIGYLLNEGVVVGNDYNAIRSNLKLEGKVTEWLTIGANVNFQNRSDGDLAVNWQGQILENSPYALYKDENGELIAHPMREGGYAQGVNSDFDRQYKDLEKGYTVLNSIFTGKVKLPFNITYSFNASPRFQWFYDRYFESSEHPDWAGTNGLVNREQAKRFDWSLNNTINWDYTFDKKHHVNLTLVQEAEERQYWQDRIEARDIKPSDALGFHETYYGNKDKSSFNSHDSRETADGMLARLFYSFDDRYMITTSVRRDGYSAFGTSNPRATFYSTAFGWTFTKEKFFNWSPMSFGKFRISWGENGNRSLADPYLALANLGAGMGKTQGYVDANGNYVQYRYMSVDRLANPNLRWEKTASWNVGLDFGFLENRVTGTVDYYVMSTKDMIMNQSLPGFSGFGSITTNLGEVENKGFELSINSLNIKNDVLEWQTTLGFSVNKNKIKHLYYVYEDVLDEEGNVIGKKEVDDVNNGWFIGEPISAIWYYRVTGIWQTDEVEEAAKYGQRPGDPKVANNYTIDDKINDDGSTTPVYNDKDREILGQTAPPIHWSLRNDFTFYKNLDFSFNIYSYWGHKSLNGEYLNRLNNQSQIDNNFNAYLRKYWTPDNPTNEYGRLNAQGPAGLDSPLKLYDRSFIRLENISLGYTLSENFVSKYGIKKLKIYGSIRNVAVWAKDWEYWDPETSGVAPRIFTIGLNLTL